MIYLIMHMQILIILTSVLTLSTAKIRELQTNIDVNVTEEEKSSSNRIVPIFNGQSCELLSYHDFYYLINIGVGSPPQNLSVILDTGSRDLEILSSDCQNCSEYLKKFDFKSSSSYVQKGQGKQGRQVYHTQGKMKVIDASQTLSLQNISLQNYSIQMINYKEDFLSFYKFDGILGMSSAFFEKNFFDTAFIQNQTSSNLFALQMGRQRFGEKSYLFYNFTLQEVNNFTFVSIEKVDNGLWVLPIYGFKMERGDEIQERNRTTNVIIDTLVSSIFLEKELFNMFKQKYFDQLCYPYQTKLQLRLCDCDASKYPTITFITSGMKFIIPPQLYLVDDKSDYCALLIQESPKLQTNYLGTVFMQRYLTIFDKYGFQMGFKDIYQPVYTLISSNQNFIFKLLFVLEAGCVIAFVCADRSSRVKRKKVDFQLSNINFDSSVAK